MKMNLKDFIVWCDEDFNAVSKALKLMYPNFDFDTFAETHHYSDYEWCIDNPWQ